MMMVQLTFISTKPFSESGLFWLVFRKQSVLTHLDLTGHSAEVTYDKLLKLRCDIFILVSSELRYNGEGKSSTALYMFAVFLYIHSFSVHAHYSSIFMYVRWCQPTGAPAFCTNRFYHF